MLSMLASVAADLCQALHAATGHVAWALLHALGARCASLYSICSLYLLYSLYSLYLLCSLYSLYLLCSLYSLYSL